MTLSRAKEPYYKMLPYKNRSNGEPSWQYEIIWNTPLYKGCCACGGNRIGKTQLGAFTTAMIVTGDHPRYKSPKKGIAWIVGLDSKAVESVCKPVFESLIPKRYKDGGSWNGKKWMWHLRADGREWQVWYKSVDSGRQKFQGSKVDFVWIDEEPLKEGIFSEIETRLVDNAGIWLMTATPVEGTRWLKEVLDRPDVYSTMAGMRENPYIPLEEVEKIASRLAEDERKVRVDGTYIVFGGRPIFNRNKIAELQQKKIKGIKGVIAA